MANVIYSIFAILSIGTSKLRIVGNSANDNCTFQRHSSKGRVIVDDALSKKCPISTFQLINPSRVLVVDIDVTSPHKGKNCLYAIDKATLPDGSECCYEESICRVYYSRELEDSSYYKSSPFMSCNTSWCELDTWPPTFTITRHLSSFQCVIDYQYLHLNESRKLNDDGISNDDRIKRKNKDMNFQRYVFPLVAAALALVILITSIILYRKKMQQSQNNADCDITPYAVHVSVHRRSYQASELQLRSPRTNPYDMPALDENEYLNPMRESPYYEIDNCFPTVVDNQTGNVYDEAESVNHHEYENNSTLLPLHKQNANEISQNHNDSTNISCNYVQSLKEAPSSQESVDYGVIIGTLNEEGKFERLKKCEVAYKSIKKK